MKSRLQQIEFGAGNANVGWHIRQRVKKWTFRISVVGLFIATLLLVIILNPILSYGNKTTGKNYSVFHHTPLDPKLTHEIGEAFVLLKKSELYGPNLKLDICLNDGSSYPKLLEALRGQAFAWGFYNKVVLQGVANHRENYVELNGYKWNLTQLLAHEMTHCMQFDHLGFWKSNPFANIPNWKWEGYAEYVSRKSEDQGDLKRNIARFIHSDRHAWGIAFPDGTIAPIEYYEYWLLVQFCMDVQKMSYKQVLSDTVSKEAMEQKMMQWYGGRN
jgi:hypothetical protein